MQKSKLTQIATRGKVRGFAIYESGGNSDTEKMFRLFKWMFRTALALIALAAVIAILFLLTYNSILRNTIQHEVRAQTGMDAQIGKFKLALASPTLRMQNVKIASAPDFGGAPFLDISEIYVDYDRVALAKKEFHARLVRINVTEFDIVKNQKGQTNIFAFIQLPRGKSGAPVKFDLKKQTGYDFQGIDELNVYVGKVKFIDLANPQNDCEQNIGLENFVIPHVKSAKDLDSLWVMIYLRSDGFFDSIFPATKKANPLINILKSSGVF
jgi:uncharacterized protein involved in outer membrane biogenesis